MSELPSPGQAAASLARELAVWAVAVGPFLYLYAGHSAGGVQAVAPHLGVVGTLWLSLVCLRLALWRWAPGRYTARIVVAVLCGVALILVAAYYALVLAGMWSWGRVVSWALIATYVGQLPSLAQSLGVSFPVALAAAVVLAGCTLAVVDWLLTRLDWTRWIATHASPLVINSLVVGSLAVVALESAQLLDHPPIARREPVSLTFLAVQNPARHLSSQVIVSRELSDQSRAERLGYRPATPNRRPNVVLIIADALRADRLALYGYDRSTTPFLMALQQQGQLSFARHAVAACPESYCGLLAIARSKPLHLMTDEDMSLHEVMRRHGYRIELILGGDHTHFYGLRQAYGAVDDYFDGSMVPGRNVNDDELVLDRVNALPRWDGRPVLLQFHLMSTHLLGQRDPKFARFVPARPYVPWQRGAATDLGKPQVETGNHYDNSVLQLDDVLRRLVAALTERQYMRDTILVLTGDHGEMLGEHGEYGHAKKVYETAMRVPLVFAGFGTAPPALDVSSSALASQLDVGPTLLHQLGMPVPRTWMGMPLQRSLPPRRLAFQQGHYVGVYDNMQPGQTLKYWRQLHTGEERVFDVGADPAELHNLLPGLDAGRLAALRAAVQPIVASVPD